MRKKTRLIAESGLCIALSVVLLYITAFIPTSTLACAAFAGFFNVIIILRHRAANGILPYIAVSLLAFWLVPEKSAAGSYILFFGYYPVIKSYIERIGNLAVEWVLKLVCFNAALTGIYLSFSFVFFDTISGEQMAVYIIYIVGNIAFILYDIAFSLVISTFGQRIARF